MRAGGLESPYRFLIIDPAGAVLLRAEPRADPFQRSCSSARASFAISTRPWRSAVARTSLICEIAR